jgi:hypothetical protein
VDSLVVGEYHQQPIPYFGKSARVQPVLADRDANAETQSQGHEGYEHQRCALPVGFLFGPGVTIPNSPVRPVGDSVRATFGNNLAITNGTHPPPSGIGFNTLTACKCIFHVA